MRVTLPFALLCEIHDCGPQRNPQKITQGYREAGHPTFPGAARPGINLTNPRHVFPCLSAAEGCIELAVGEWLTIS